MSLRKSSDGPIYQSDLSGNYGNVAGNPTNTITSVWGHRLIVGQDPFEYLLEFLNVLAGFDYQLGKVSENYKKSIGMGLRKFVFYDPHTEKTRTPSNDQGYQQLIEYLQSCQWVTDNGPDNPIEFIADIKSLLRTFAVIDRSRSWYAKSLFPVHQSFLFWQADKENARGKDHEDDVSIESIYRGLSYTRRNFFARGGEIYYLLLSLGTENRPQLREKIESHFKRLLQSSGSAFGKLAENIDQAWKAVAGVSYDNSAGEGSLGYIPLANRFAEQTADEVATLLTYGADNLDTLETMDLLFHLVSFHICAYIWHRSQVWSNIPPAESALLIDCLPAGKDGTFHQASQATFRNQEVHIAEISREDRQSGGKSTSKDNIIGIPRKLGKSIGLLAPKTGASARFILDGSLLRTIVLATVQPEQPVEYSTFLNQLYVRYNLVIGPIEAREASLKTRFDLAEDYYTRNRERFLERLIRAGLAKQYSDATALVSPGGMGSWI